MCVCTCVYTYTSFVNSMWHPKCLCGHLQQVAPHKWPISITTSLCLHYIITSYISVVHLGCVCVCVCDWHLDNIYLSHFNVLSIQSGTPAMAAKPLCGEKRFQGVHPHYWSHVSEVQKGRSDGAEVSRGMSTTALQGLSFSPNTRWCRIYQLFLTGMFIQENWNCLGGKREPQVHNGPFL